MRSPLMTLAALALMLAIRCTGQEPAAAAGERVFVDAQGVIRWTADRREVALFGANYSLASACDYRAAGYVGADRRKLVDEDLTHFARMGWDGIRLCFWGDWENCDPQGNLIANDHLDLLDYAIAVAARRGLGILLTPITTYSSVWPDGQDGPEIRGFSKSIPKDKLGTDPAAIAAQCNYLRQILAHVNPYTGVALKDEPAILFVEMINEPAHHPADLAGSIRYIDTLADAVRSTGCRKLLFHNLSQDFDIAPAIKASTVPGMSFAWYPTGLNVGHALRENHLRSVDDYPPMARPDLRDAPKLVYEFDSADVNGGAMYPAMVRAFRGAGAQFIAMFSYDMLATAPYNLGWQTHFLNLVYSPRKAMSAIIAAEAARVLPRYSRWGDYPANRRFGPFRVSYEEDTSEMVTAERFLYANDTQTPPPDAAALRQVIGLGSSPVVAYEGAGIYFLERLAAGVWRLELYPDALAVQDPFAQRQNYQTVAVRLVTRSWPMTVRLPDLGGEFAVEALNVGNACTTAAREGRFVIRPGVYLLSKHAVPDRTALPQRVGGVGLAEFVCPTAPVLPAQILPALRDEYPAGPAAEFAVQVIDSRPPKSVTLRVRAGHEMDFRIVPMEHAAAYRFTAAVATVATSMPADSDLEYAFEAETAEGEIIRYPVGEGNVLHAAVVRPTAPLRLFSAAADAGRIVYTRVGDTVRHGIFKNLPATATEPAALRVFLPFSRDPTLDDYTASLAVKDRVVNRGASVSWGTALRIKARGASDGLHVHVTLVESNGTSWSTVLTLGAGWQEFEVPIGELKIARGVMLPLGFPGRWNYWLTPAQGRGGAADRPQLSQVEHLQFSLRPEPAEPKRPDDPWVDLASVTLEPGPLGGAATK